MSTPTFLEGPINAAASSVVLTYLAGPSEYRLAFSNAENIIRTYAKPTCCYECSLEQKTFFVLSSQVTVNFPITKDVEENKMCVDCVIGLMQRQKESVERKAAETFQK